MTIGMIILISLFIFMIIWILVSVSLYKLDNNCDLGINIFFGLLATTAITMILIPLIIIIHFFICIWNMPIF
jgi:hypothetical protein